ncbi:MAG: flavodoxin family protein [Proteobacteria bacterium]|nr:flavodoxin family protein [Pseudomonadota bacterium]
MNILAINGSPRGKRSNTDKILLPFLEGAAGAGASTELLYVKDLDVNPCQGCFNCHMKTPGRCIFQDDMPGVLEKMKAAEILVFAAPLYVFSVPAQFKAFLDRLMVLGDLKLDFVDGIVVHPPRWTDIQWKWVVISNAGFPEPEHFQPMLDMYRRFARAIGGGAYVTLSADICKGMGELLANKPLLPQFEWFFEACRQAGAEMVRDGQVSEATRAVLDRPLLDVTPREFADMANFYIEKAARLIREKQGD